jgi:hypothetical protein
MVILPPELVSVIITLAGDWELATSLGVYHEIPKSTPWIEQALPLDHAILPGRISTVKAAIAAGHDRFTTWGARAMIRFGFVNLLDFFRERLYDNLAETCGFNSLLTTTASAWGRLCVLEWAHEHNFGFDRVDPEAMDDASRHGHVDVLEWWIRSGRPLEYSEHALQSATVKRQLAVLEWWRTSGLPLKISKVLDFASMEGSTTCLEWWSASGLPCDYSTAALYFLSLKGDIPLLNWWRSSRFQLSYNRSVLVGATKYGRLESLEWWLESELPLVYNFFEIEEALEDAKDGKEEVREWWSRRGLSSAIKNENWDEWMSDRLLKK